LGKSRNNIPSSQAVGDDLVKVVIRTDASIQIGTGHVMRCLTLAEGLKYKSAQVEFICREHEGNMIDYIKNRGFKVHVIPVLKKDTGIPLSSKLEVKNTLDHRGWLGSTQEQDAEICHLILGKLSPDWLIVDHYSLDRVWQMKLHGSFQKLMVIDDLADRNHICDLILDQTYGRGADDYKSLVPSRCRVLVGSKYALLRPEFSEWRKYSLRRRENPNLKKILITMGGVDRQNITEMVLDELKNCDIPAETLVIIVMGITSPYLASVRRKIKSFPFKAEIKSNVTNMAELMANSDVAIGTSGATTWERCCLGLPSIQITAAKNQTVIADYISKSGAALSVTVAQLDQLKIWIIILKRQIKDMAKKSAEVTDGTGLIQVLRYLK
jgi:UDP-2,4-diacetamido-2,4,6-trideoxy-beta-L-altropyranose hydrolase